LKKGRVRPIALCLFRHEGKILVGEGWDEAKGQTYYRPLGGRIEFGEYGAQTVVREIREELEAQVVEVEYLFTLENVFTHNGEAGHEITLVYDGRFADRSLYEREEIEGHEDEVFPITGVWKSIEDFGVGGAILYPTGLWERLQEEV
jgi:8-oxo-dGTP pyrophosphatase MutT (NUDIX family)